MRTSFLIIGAWVWMVLLWVQAFWYARKAWSHPGEADHDAPVSMVYLTAFMTLLISGMVSMKLLYILGRQEGRIRRLEQLTSQLPPAHESGSQP
jgi:hypothetical protein